MYTYTPHSHIDIGADRIIIMESDAWKGNYTYRIIAGDIDHTCGLLYGCLNCTRRAAIASYKRYTHHNGKMPAWEIYEEVQ